MSTEKILAQNNSFLYLYCRVQKFSKKLIKNKILQMPILSFNAHAQSYFLSFLTCT